MKRSWEAARQKVLSEGCCRICGFGSQLEAAHIIPRSRINAGAGGEDPRNIIPLCRSCHRRQHSEGLEILGALDLEEQAFIVSLVGIEEARRRVTA